MILDRAVCKTSRSVNSECIPDRYNVDCAKVRKGDWRAHELPVELLDQLSHVGMLLAETMFARAKISRQRRLVDLTTQTVGRGTILIIRIGFWGPIIL